MSNAHKINISSNSYESFLCYAIRDINRIDPSLLLRRYKTLNDEILYAHAKKNGVAEIVGHALTHHFLVDFKLPEHWSLSFAHTGEIIGQYMEELDRIADHFAVQSIPLIALKNSGITRGLYPYYGASPMGDLDLLVVPNEFYQAHQILLKMGYTLKFRNKYESNSIKAAFKSGGSEYKISLKSGLNLWVELQWRPVAGRWIQPKQEPRATELFVASSTIVGTHTKLLSPVDNLLQVCLHTAKHSFVRSPGFRLHTDVDRIIGRTNIDWKFFLNKVNSLNVKTPVYFSLALARNLLDTEVPEEVLDDLKPSVWKFRLIGYWLNSKGIFNPDEKKWSNIGFILFTALLYDNPRDLLRAVFPKVSEIRKKDPEASVFFIPAFYVRRIFSLIFRRTGI